MSGSIRRLVLRRRRAVTAIEYGLIAAAIIVAILGSLRLVGTNLNAVFNDVNGTFWSVIYPSYNGPDFTVSSTQSDYCGINSSFQIYYCQQVNYASPANGNTSYTLADPMIDPSGGVTAVVITAHSAPMAIPGPNGFGKPGAFTMPTGDAFHLNVGSNAWSVGFTAGTSVAGIQAGCIAGGGTFAVGNSNTDNCTYPSGSSAMANIATAIKPYIGG